MNIFQVGDIVVNNNSWLVGLLGVPSEAGVVIHTSNYSSVIYLFISHQEITLMNDYIDKIKLNYTDIDLKVGDLVELKPKIKSVITIRGVGTIIDTTIIKTNDFDGKFTDEDIKAYLVYFPEEDYEFTIPCSCLQLFLGQK